jgi:hypothetical protein
MIGRLYSYLKMLRDVRYEKTSADLQRVTRHNVEPC